MNFNFIYEGSRSFSFELDNKFIYKTPKNYKLYVDGRLYLESDKNINSVFNLIPDKLYEITLNYEDESVTKIVKTKKEYVTLNVKKFGAKGDGKTNDTAFIQACINACPINGRVFIPKGDYFCGPLFLKSDITIELDESARIVGDTNRFNYPILPGMTLLTDESDDYNLGSWEGNPLDCYASLITGINVSNVNIIGKGIIDGNAGNADWWKEVKIKRGSWRPRGVFLNNCSNIIFQGVTVTNTPSWNLHPYFSKDIKFIDLSLVNPKNSPNTDGCDPESCKNVDILGVYFSVGDDCIAIKSGKIYMGKTYKTPSDGINIRNCAMNFGHGSIVLGSEMSGGIKNININQCLFNKTDRGLRIKTRRGRGKDAIIDGITFENIEMDDVLTPIVINSFYYCDPDGMTEYVSSKEPLPVDERTPYLGRFFFKNIICNNVNTAAGTIYGLPEQKIEEISLDNVVFNYSKNPKPSVPAMMEGVGEMCGKGIILMNVKTVKLHDVKFNNFNDKKIEEINCDKIDLN